MSGGIALDGSLISVVVPVYRVERYLRSCLNSIIGQTHQNLEIILVDDGSPDQCGAICDEYAAKDKRIIVIHKENTGAGAARNIGLKRAKGKYISFLDADDMYRLDALAKAYARAVACDADIVIFGSKIIDQAGNYLYEKSLNTDPLPNGDIFSAKEVPGHLYQITGCDPWNKLFRREFVLSRDIRFQTLRTANDLYFTSFAMACAERIAVLQEPLAIHRIRNSENLQTLKKEVPLDFLMALEQGKTDLQSCSLWKTLQQSFVNFALEHCAYNYETLHKAGRRKLVSQRDRLCELLELRERDESYYYNRNSYQKCRYWLFCREGDKHMGWLKQVKEFLKKFLPPPVRAFNREMSALRQFIQEQVTRFQAIQYKETEQVLEIFFQQQKQMDTQQQQLESLAEKLQESLIIQQALDGRLMGLEQQILTLKERVIKLDKFEILERRILELDKFDRLERQLQELDKFDILEQQLLTLDKFDSLEKNLQKGIDEARSSMEMEIRLAEGKQLEGIARAQKSVERIRDQVMESTRYASEAVWGEIFNNTISNSTWLYDKAFSPGRWAVGYPYLYVMYRVLNETNPKTILELGLGQSTRMIAQYAKTHKGIKHVVVEHDWEWIKFFQNQHEDLFDCTQIVQLERKMEAYKEAKAVRVFKGFRERFEHKKFDFILIDAPLGSDMKEYSRIDILQILPDCLSKDFIIMIDDTDRCGETHTVAEIEAVLDKHEIKYKKGRYSGKKDFVLIGAERFGFMTSM